MKIKAAEEAVKKPKSENMRLLLNKERLGVLR